MTKGKRGKRVGGRPKKLPPPSSHGPYSRQAYWAWDKVTKGKCAKCGKPRGPTGSSRYCRLCLDRIKAKALVRYWESRGVMVSQGEELPPRPTWTCLCCGHSWMPRGKSPRSGLFPPPKRCPNCWNTTWREGYITGSWRGMPHDEARGSGREMKKMGKGRRGDGNTEEGA